MSIESALRDAVSAALLAEPRLKAGLNRLGDGESEGAPVPAAWIGEIIGSEWGAKDRPGREIRLGLTIADRGPSERIAGLVDACEAALVALPRSFAGWENGGAALTRLRMTRRADGLRLALIDVRVRAWRI